jgi:hypothetical protein
MNALMKKKIQVRVALLSGDIKDWADFGIEFGDKIPADWDWNRTTEFRDERTNVEVCSEYA